MLARRDYLRFIKNRKPRKKTIRKARGQQLRYVRRDLCHIEKQLAEVSIDVLSVRQKQHLETIKILYAQQEKMHKNHTFSIENRIVSISQPWVRPIVRGKAKCDTEFGAKITICMVNGYAFVDKLSWDAYNEEGLLIPAIEAYREKYGVYPESVLA
ncbi:MAG: IS5/IS1182 family transposase, partial [Defluviitaleaceae bacterium]|nr:IS5/IS1182 family transposase [Defluviitaleaceae bacterium]